MTLEGCKVQAVCEICPYSNGLTRNMVQCLYDFDIPLYLSHTILKIKGKDRVEGVTIAKVDEKMRPIPGTEFEIECDTLLLSVGLIPENELSRVAGVEIAPFTNGPKVDQHRQTNLPGIYAAGNVVHVHDLVDFVSDEADIAGKFAPWKPRGSWPRRSRPSPSGLWTASAPACPRSCTCRKAVKLPASLCVSAPRPVRSRSK